MSRHTTLRMLTTLLAIASGTAFARGVVPTPPTPISPPPPQSYVIDEHFIGAGGESSGANFRIQGSLGQWEVDMLKMTGEDGTALEGGFWPNLDPITCAANATETNPNCP
jgi:hypothetical protein